MTERDELTAEMMEWVRGERSHWNSVGNTSDNRLFELQTCAVMDAQEVVKIAAAINALSVMEATKPIVAKS